MKSTAAPMAGASQERIPMTEQTEPRPIEELSFEDALAELESIVANLEQGRSNLDSAIAAYERGAALKRHCEAKLRDAREKVERITLDASGEPAGTRPLGTE